MKLIIAGGRDYQLKPSDYARLNALHDECYVYEVVYGGAPGADECGARWATDEGIGLRCFPADWKTHGKAAGPIRNRQMAEYADAVALFPGGRGTQSMYEEAKRVGIEIYDFRKSRELE